MMARQPLRLRLWLLQLLLLAAPTCADVFLPKWFGDVRSPACLALSLPQPGSRRRLCAAQDMVLQTTAQGGARAFLAGVTRPPGEEVTISGDAGTYRVTSEVGSGHWKVTLDAVSEWRNTDSGMTIRVRAATGPAVVAARVLPGDVFFCAGQSNMLFSLHQSINYTAEAATLASFPNFRFFMTNRALNSTPQTDLTTDDGNCDAAVPPAPPRPPPPPSAATCSAKTFLNNTFFGRGHGPSIGHGPGTDAADCCTKCSKMQRCLFFSFAGGTCWFKAAAHGPPRPSPGAISGAVGGPPPPPPPPRPCNRWVTPAEASANEASYLLSFSAVCFLTIRDIARQHTGQRPMALVQSAWGGSRLESWMSAEAIAAAASPVRGAIPPNNNKAPSGAANDESALYNGMVSPWTNFSIRAALWYQGEENADQSCQVNSSMWPGPPAAHRQPIEYYSAAYAAMAEDWRAKKGVNFSLATMQLPPSVKAGVNPAESNPMWAGRPDIRSAEAVSPAHPGNTTDESGVAVTIDLGGASNWGNDHPPNKPEMSRRLSLALLHTAYGLGQEAIPLWTGPVLASAELKRAEVTLTFTEESAAGGLSLRDVTAPTSVDDGRGGVASATNNCTRCCDGGGAPFELTIDPNPAGARIAGRNITWTRLPRSAITLGATTVTLDVSGLLQHSNVAARGGVTGVRYAWSDFVDCVLDNGNSSGIPAGPFRHWF